MRLVILDRDGVINRDSAEHIKAPEEWHPIPGSLEAIARLNHAGFRVVVATNQSGVARKLLDIEALNQIHEKMHRQLAEIGGHVEAVYFCPCHPNDACRNRKPLPGMLIDIGERLRVALDQVPVVGDSYRDIEAARAVGAQPVLVLTGNGAATIADHSDLDDVAIYDDLSHAVDALIQHRP